MNIIIGSVISRNVDINSVPENITGSIITTATTRTIIMVNAIIRILNFNVNSPYKSIKETLYYVNREELAREKPAFRLTHLRLAAPGDIK